MQAGEVMPLCVHRLDWFSRIDGKRVEWFETHKDAKFRQNELYETLGSRVGEVEVQAVYLPQTRVGFVRWLNENLNNDNV